MLNKSHIVQETKQNRNNTENSKSKKRKELNLECVFWFVCRTSNFDCVKCGECFAQLPFTKIGLRDQYGMCAQSIFSKWLSGCLTANTR